MFPEAGEHGLRGAGGQERQDVAGTHDEVKFLPGQGQRAEVAQPPVDIGVVQPGGVDEFGVQVNAHHPVPAPGQFPSHPAGAASGIQDPCGPGHQRVGQPGLAVQVNSVGTHAGEAGNEPRRMPGIVSFLGFPQILAFHGPRLQPSGPRHGPGALRQRP